MFPDAYFHIGGDECNGKEWNANPQIQAFMRAHGMKDNAALQSYFTARVQKLLAGHHKIMEGWDEVLQPETPRDVVIQSWRGAEGTGSGGQTRQSRGAFKRLLHRPGTTRSEHYLVDLLAGDAASLTPEQKARVLGGEATMWSEYVTNENIDAGIWPRTAAIAERFWSPQDVRDVDSMYKRLSVVSQRLQYYGLEHRSGPVIMLERLSGSPEVPWPLEVLAAVTEPPKGYSQSQMRDYHPGTPLNQLADAVPPESDVARRFHELAILIAAGKASAQERKEARDWLVLWRDNDAKLQPLLGTADLMAELVPVSQTLSATASIGLRALDDIESHRVADNATTRKDAQTLKAAAKPQAVLLDMVAPSVQMLVQAAAAQP